MILEDDYEFHHDYAHDTFSEKDYSGITVQCLDFTAQRFVKTKISDAIFEACDFRDITFDGIVFKSINFVECDFTGSTFEDSEIEQCTFSDCKFDDVEFINSTLSDAKLSSCDGELSFSDSMVFSTTFDSCILDNSKFGSGWYDWLQFIDTSFCNVALTKDTALGKMEFEGTLIDGTNFTTAYDCGSGIDWSGAVCDPYINKDDVEAFREKLKITSGAIKTEFRSADYSAKVYCANLEMLKELINSEDIHIVRPFGSLFRQNSGERVKQKPPQKVRSIQRPSQKTGITT